MRYVKVDRDNVEILYKLNKKLAYVEGQSYLFSAKKREYKKAFVKKHPIVYALLVYKNDKPIGFIIYMLKFATYLAKEVLYIEDIYLKDNYLTYKRVDKLLKFIIKFASKKGFARVEMRVLRDFSLDKTLLRSNGFNRVEKWDVYRYEPKKWSKSLKAKR